MSEPSNMISEIVARVRIVLVRSAQGDRDGSTTALSELRPVIRGRRLLSHLEAIAFGRSDVLIAGDDLFVTGSASDSVAMAAEKAMRALTGRVGCARPLVLLSVTGRDDHANLLNEIDGVFLVSLSQQESLDEATLLHELAHSLSLANHRILDEGWSEWLVSSIEMGDVVDLEQLIRSAYGSPSASALLAKRWTEQPYFEEFDDATRLAIRAGCTLIVGELVGRIGIDGMLKLMSAVRASGCEDCRPLVEAMAGTCSTSWTRFQPDPHQIQALAHDAVRRAFTLGNADDVRGHSSAIALAHATDPDDTDAAVSHLMILLLSASDPSAPDARLSAARALRGFVEKHGDIPISYALCASLAGIEVRHASNILALNESFGRGRAIISEGLRLFPKDLDVLAASAKFELSTPHEQGGSREFSAELLLRAAAASPWPEVSDHLNRLASYSLDSGLSL